MNRKREASNEPIGLDEIPAQKSPSEKQAWKIPWWIWPVALGLLFGLRSMIEAKLQAMVEPGWDSQKFATLSFGSWNDWALDSKDNLYRLYMSKNLVVAESKNRYIDLPPELADIAPSIFDTLNLNVDSQHRIWVYWASNGYKKASPVVLAVYTLPLGWKVFQSENNRVDAKYSDLIIDNSDRAWVATDYGLAVVDATQESSTFSFDDMGLPGVNILDFAVSPRGQLWVDNGHELISQQEEGIWKSYGGIDPDSSGYNAGMFFDAKGKLWINYLRSTDLAGFWFLFDSGGNFEGNQKWAQNGRMMDGEGRFWDITDKGLFVSDESIGRTRYPLLPEMKGGAFYELKIDSQNRIWVGVGHFYMYVFDPTAVPDVQTFKTYGLILSLVTYAIWGVLLAVFIYLIRSISPAIPR